MLGLGSWELVPSLPRPTCWDWAPRSLCHPCLVPCAGIGLHTGSSVKGHSFQRSPWTWGSSMGQITRCQKPTLCSYCKKKCQQRTGLYYQECRLQIQESDCSTVFGTSEALPVQFWVLSFKKDMERLECIQWRATERVRRFGGMTCEERARVT